jgi:hypothetical protein
MPTPIRPSAFIATASPETIARIRAAVPAGLAAMSPLPALSAPVRAWLDADRDDRGGPDLSAVVRAFVDLPDDISLDDDEDQQAPAAVRNARA